MTKKRRKLKKEVSVLILLCICLLVVVCVAFSFVMKSCTNKMVIAIDAGHDASNQGYSGFITEYDYDVKMSEALEKIIKEDKKFDVILTHNFDEDKPMTMRKEIMDKADLVLSIHAGSDSNASTSGIHVISKPPVKKGYNQSKKVAEAICGNLENSTCAFEYYEPIKENTYAIKYVDITDETKYDYPLLENMDCTDTPLVQIEGLYVTNQEDCNTYMSDESIEMVAKSIYEAIKEVYGK